MPSAVPGKLEVRREACLCPRACEDPRGLGAYRRSRGAGRGRRVRLGFEGFGSGPGPLAGWRAKPWSRRCGREAWQVL